jgi:hypothetical protein
MRDQCHGEGDACKLSERFGLEVHAFVLMHNHDHLLVRTTEPKPNQAMRWFNGVTEAAVELARKDAVEPASFLDRQRCVFSVWIPSQTFRALPRICPTPCERMQP